MECYCNSKDLYRGDYLSPDETFWVDGKEQKRRRVIDEQLVLNSHPCEAIEERIIESTEMWMPNEIDRISWDEIAFNPLWFYQKYLSKNIPCIITDVLQGDDIF